jgi:hypothetical protein
VLNRSTLFRSAPRKRRARGRRSTPLMALFDATCSGHPWPPQRPGEADPHQPVHSPAAWPRADSPPRCASRKASTLRALAKRTRRCRRVPHPVPPGNVRTFGGRRRPCQPCRFGRSARVERVDPAPLGHAARLGHSPGAGLCRQPAESVTTCACPALRTPCTDLSGRRPCSPVSQGR